MSPYGILIKGVEIRNASKVQIFDTGGDASIGNKIQSYCQLFHYQPHCCFAQWLWIAVIKSNCSRMSSRAFCRSKSSFYRGKSTRNSKWILEFRSIFSPIIASSALDFMALAHYSCHQNGQLCLWKLVLGPHLGFIESLDFDLQLCGEIYKYIHFTYNCTYL